MNNKKDWLYGIPHILVHCSPDTWLPQAQHSYNNRMYHHTTFKAKKAKKKLIFGAQYKCNKNIVSTNKPKSEGKIHLDTVL